MEIVDKQENAPTAYAGFWIRAAAAFIDWLILGAVTYIITYLIIGPADKTVVDPMSNAVSMLVGWLYFAYLESSEYQATIGKRAVGIKVTDMQGNRISFANATGRHFAKILSAIILLIGFIMVAFDERRQGLHDKIAHTLVVNAKKI